MLGNSWKKVLNCFKLFADWCSLPGQMSLRQMALTALISNDADMTLC